MAEQKTKQAEPESDPQAGADHTYDEPEKVVPSKGDDGYDTPSGHALAKVGVDGDGDKYAAEKSKKRWGVS